MYGYRISRKRLQTKCLVKFDLSSSFYFLSFPKLIPDWESGCIFDLERTNSFMAANIITIEDLQNFKRELFEEIKNLLGQRNTQPARKWLKSHEVRRLLTISPGTIQNLRINGTLPFTKIGGTIYYNYDDILKMLEKNKP